MIRLRFILIFCFLTLWSVSSDADVVHLKNGGRQMGIIVDKYADRIVLSIPEGEVEIMIDQVKNIVYDDPESNYMMLASKYEERKDYEKAVTYYNMALELKPNLREAKDAINRINDIIDKKRKVKEELLAKLREKKEQLLKMREEQESILRQNVGFNIEKEGDDFRITDIMPESEAAKAGIQKDDYLVSVWDKATKYMPREEVIKLLSGAEGSKINITVQKEIKPQSEEISWGTRSFKGIGASLSMETEGLTVISVMQGKPADIAGLKPLDIIISINKEPTRYMPMEEAIKTIANSQGQTIDLLINRRIELTRGPDFIDKAISDKNIQE
ncbi:MAG: PDZ domain-containing protein [bacterium]|nr:PDZ domain-containing protein [bacterium]